jgi:hypothetical protein
MIKVQCRCGAVEVEITAEPIVQFYCHCDDCQAVHGGAYAPESVYPADAVKVVRGDPTTWRLKRIHASLPRMRHAPVHRCRSEAPARRQWIPAPLGQVPACVSCAVPVRGAAHRRRPSALQGDAEAFRRFGRNGWVVEPRRLHRRRPSCPRNLASSRTSKGMDSRFRGNDTACWDRSDQMLRPRTYTRSARRPGSGQG